MGHVGKVCVDKDLIGKILHDVIVCFLVLYSVCACLLFLERRLCVNQSMEKK